MVIWMIAAAVAGQGETRALPAFMAGCWNLTEGVSWTQECWMEPKAGIMLGASREGSGEKLKSWEQMRIGRTADGKAALFASPEGRPAVVFTATRLTLTAVEFVNAAHDYPQRIAYELKGNLLAAEISLADGKKPIRWVYKRESR